MSMKAIFAKCKVLIVDDFSDFRMSMKHMLQQMGAEDIDQASNAIDAIKQCTQNKYHIILCDYNLGPGQNGQQIHEELHERKLISRDTLFLMVTAETSAAKVMGAIECQPDAYLSKPFTREQLAQRLKRLLTKNAAMNKIYAALNHNNQKKALELCDQAIEEFPKVKFACMRLKAEILEKQQKYKETQQLFKQVMEDQPLLWAMIGIGQSHYNQENYKEALDYFLEMRESFPSQVTVLDWIAKCQRALGKNQQAETVIEEALKISPHSVKRLSSLGEVAEELSHHDIAITAYSTAISEGSHSCLLKPEHFQRYYENTRELVSQLEGREQTRLLENAEAVSKQMEQRYQANPAALAFNLSALARLSDTASQTEKTARFLNKLNKALDKVSCQLSYDEVITIEKNLNAISGEKATSDTLKNLSSKIEIKKKEAAVNAPIEDDKSSDNENVLI